MKCFVSDTDLDFRSHFEAQPHGAPSPQRTYAFMRRLNGLLYASHTHIRTYAQEDIVIRYRGRHKLFT